MQKLNIQFFAELADIMNQHTDIFTEGNDFGTRFDGIKTKLQELGYDVLINNKAQAEFIPASRFSEVVKQRDGFKSQADQAIKDLNALKTQPGISPEAQKQIDDLISNNKSLLDGLKNANTRIGIITEFSDAIDSSDVVRFIDDKKLKTDLNGNITGGLKEEHERLKSEKPYLFKILDDKRKHGGFEGSSGSDGGKVTMNNLIRRAAYGN